MVSRESKSSPDGSENGAGSRSNSSRRRQRRTAPLDETTLRDLALSYAARFATTAAKLEAYLARKIRERGVAEDADGRVRELDVTGLVKRIVELGYVDDDAFARSRSRDLTQRGYGKRRVEQALWAAGIEEETRAEHAPDEAAGRRAAMLLAKKRGFAPFARAPLAEDETPEAAHKRREKQVAAMLRAGHLFDHIQFIMAATNPEAVEAWVIEAEEDARDDF